MFFFQFELGFPHSNFYKGTRIWYRREVFTFRSLSLSLSLSFSRFSSSPRLSSSFDSRNDKQFHWIENSEFELIFSQRERVLKGFELERISIVKSLCPCSFSRDDDSSS